MRDTCPGIIFIMSFQPVSHNSGGIILRLARTGVTSGFPPIAPDAFVNCVRMVLGDH